MKRIEVMIDTDGCFLIFMQQVLLILHDMFRQ